MALSHTSTLFDIDDCKIYPLTADPSGGSPTYGTGIDLPGIQQLQVTFDILTKDLYGDGQVLVTKSKIRKVNATANHAKISLSALAAMIGGTATDTGTTPNQKSDWTLSGHTAPPPFKLEAQILAVDFVPSGGDAHIIIHNATASAAGLGGAQEDFSIPSLGISGVPLISTGKVISVVFNETAVALT